MKKETIGIIMLATVGIIGLGAMFLGRDWEYERTEEKRIKTPNEKLIEQGIDTVLITGAELCYWPENIPIDWNWFKKGYTPVFVTSVNGRSGDYIYSDTLNDLAR